MADMTSIINEIKGLDEYVKAMKKVHKQQGLQEDLDNVLMHINNLKAWAGLNVDVGENTLPIQRVSVSDLGLYATRCLTEGCVYNVARMCKNRDVGVSCRSHSR